MPDSGADAPQSRTRAAKTERGSLDLGAESPDASSAITEIPPRAHKPPDAAPNKRGTAADLAASGESVVRSSIGVPNNIRGWLVNLTLFGLTVVSTTAFGQSVVQSFNARRTLEVDSLLNGYLLFYRLDPAFWRGLSFSIPLLVILLAHEFGHYFACRRGGVDASLPYFLPSPLLLGTFGAFIRIRSPIYRREHLFDIGISGPLAGFAMLLPFLLIGVALSVPLPPGSADQGSFAFGLPLAMRATLWLCFGGFPTHLALHPFAVAAWAGLLATAMNLLPMGQLDGGHVLYALIGERAHRIVSTAVVVLLIGLGFLYRAWWGWAAVMFFLGRRHPLVYDRSPLRGTRILLGAAALLVLALSLAVVPVSIR